MQRVERRRDLEALVFVLGLLATLLVLSLTLGGPGLS